ncbi:MAG TPA: galactose/glucose ABC transporter substrate-binding protein MglB [Clostridiaceae bacterium]|nr:galactose/glucose ABC transporter substrate-binding protein MglB [Clostridiaceae bacterium]
MKKLLAFLLAALLLLSFVGCSKSQQASEGDTSQKQTDQASEQKSNDDAGKEQKADDKFTIGVCIYKYDDTYMSSVRQAIEKEAAAVPNVELLMNDSKGDQATQNDQIDILIEKGVDALAINIVDIGAVQTVLDKAQAANIPIVFFNREPDANVLAKYDKARFVGTNPIEAGIIQGEMMAEIWNNGDYDTNGDGVMQYVMLMGDADNPEAIARTQYSIETVEKKGIKTEELGMQICNWDADKANTAVSAWFAKMGDKIEFVVANNDSMASGAIAALQAAGYNSGDPEKFIPVVGVDATEEAKNLINNGYMSGTVKQDAEGMAKAVFQLSFNAAQGKDFLEGTNYKYDDSNIAIRIPYQPYSGN